MFDPPDDRDAREDPSTTPTGAETAPSSPLASIDPPATDPDPGPVPAPTAPSGPEWPAVAYWAAARSSASQARAVDTAPPAAPPPPTWTRAYELPGARKIVTTGLQLAVATSHPIRRASIYIGLLVLASFGPAVLAVLLTMGRLGDYGWDLLYLAVFSPDTVPALDPALVGVVLALALVFLLATLLFLAISVDAQVIAIALLGGQASDQPLRLWEAIVRARQTFWRMVGAGSLVGAAGLFLQLVLLGVFGGFSPESEAASLLTTLLVTLVLAPFAYISTAIVLGDVGAMESISRSWRLFRARPRLGFAVVLFTVVTSAIQFFALGAGLELVLGAADILQVSFTEGALSLAVATVLILAVVSAYGSLTFTIGAIVVAPQVTGFLGMTYFSGGLDKARHEAAKPPRGFRWVTRPMLSVIAAIVLLTAVEVPAINSIQAPVGSPLREHFDDLAEAHAEFLDFYGLPAPIEDATGDNDGAGAELDIVLADVGSLYTMPAWLLDEELACDADGVQCSADAPEDPDVWEEGAWVFVQRHAAAPGDPSTSADRAWGIVVQAGGGDTVPLVRGVRYPGATHAIVTARTSTAWTISMIDFELGSYRTTPTSSRSRWIDGDLFTFVPALELPDWPTRWDAFAEEPGSDDPSGVDVLRPGLLDPMLTFGDPLVYEFWTF